MPISMPDRAIARPRQAIRALQARTAAKPLRAKSVTYALGTTVTHVYGMDTRERCCRGGIRTPERREPLPVFKTGALNHSATRPGAPVFSPPATARQRVVYIAPTN